MSNRERWTIYPLLFLTLGIALTDKLEKRIDIDTIVCRRLSVIDRDQIPKVVITSQPAGGIIKTQGRQRQVILGNGEQVDGMLITEANGNVLNGLVIFHGVESPNLPLQTQPPGNLGPNIESPNDFQKPPEQSPANDPASSPNPVEQKNSPQTIIRDIK